MKLTTEQVDLYQKDGFITVENLFQPSEMDRAIQEAHQWQEEFIAEISETDKNWYLDGSTSVQNQVRKLDNPVSQRPLFRDMALSPKLVSTVERLIGKDVIAFFSQVFFKPPYGGGPKPPHQDNFYFGPDQSDHTITVWIAFDDALRENGCLYYGKGSNLGELIEHYAPEKEPFNYH
jgi:ectoine hydroxylase-related dioxygenase (phytanoyl-CoA dioxygenase family)